MKQSSEKFNKKSYSVGPKCSSSRRSFEHEVLPVIAMAVYSFIKLSFISLTYFFTTHVARSEVETFVVLQFVSQLACLLLQTKILPSGFALPFGKICIFFQKS